MIEYTKEPWSKDRAFAKREMSGSGTREWVYILREDYERAVACVNACAGIPTDQLAQLSPPDGLAAAAEEAIAVLRRHGLLVDDHGTRIRVREMVDAADRLAAELEKRGR